MLRRTTKIQLVLFVVITLLGITYVGANYVGLAKYVGSNNSCTVSADFPDSGGIFSNAEVTYRGVTVGRVGALHLISHGVRVDLALDDCATAKIPASTGATIANRSVVGEQFVNLVPPNDGNGQYLRAGANIPMSRNKIPTATQTLLVNIDKLVRSVNLDNLRTTVSELDKALSGRGGDLGRLLDATSSLLTAANEPSNLQATISLINDSSTVLQTQLDQQDPLRSWTHSLRLLSEQLKKSDPDIRHLIDTAPGDLKTVRTFISNNRTDIGVTLANLVITGRLLVSHLGGLEQVLELYPALAAGGPTALRGGHGQLGLVLQQKQLPEDCGKAPNSNDRQGYGGTTLRDPSDLTPIPANVAARCTGPASGPNYTNVRGSAHVPGGDPISLSGGDYAYNRAVTSNLRIGMSLTQSGRLGDASWLALLTDALH